ncbi:MAG: DUF499 domain-containing protein [Candidatus Lokiarchaeota archaeon]|nr:DUF499 domain-containing protein [Candidatus Lokiarchaeota archaeon]
MKAFHTIAVPHQDILEGRLTMNVFAADLWEVSKNRGTEEYRDAQSFFEKTYLTQGLENLLSVVKKRVDGKGGDPVIQIQTPFGGGKTHALISMFHRAQEWGVKRVVAVGTALGTDTTLWGMLEQNLVGEISKCKGQVSPGKEIIRSLLEENQPVIILMDEVLEYVTKAAGVVVGSNTLAAQTIAFMQELTEAISTLEKVCCIITLPASLLEHYDESAEKLFQQIQKVSGRVEKIYTPVQENEIAKIIRRRLFSDIDNDESKAIVKKFMSYAEKEDLLPAMTQRSNYRDRFYESYPFMPEVIDVLYHRWGSFHSFQRTRGVLRLLSLIVNTLKQSSIPYISLADFNLGNQEIRQELLKHIGSEFNSVIGADISDAEAGCKKVNASLGRSYQGLNIGTRTATTIFMYSFSGGQENGISLGELKRVATTLENPSPLIAEAVEQLKSKLFYLQSRGDRYFFSNQANLNRLMLNNMENIKENEVTEIESELLRKSISGHKFRTYIWEENSGNINDSEELKLVVLKKENNKLINEIIRSKGQTPRVNRNTLFFIFPMESERSSYSNTIKKKIALENISNDKSINLSEDQKKEVNNELKKLKGLMDEAIRKLYRMIAIPIKDSFKHKDLGIPTYGVNRFIDDEIYEQLKMDGEVFDKIAPLVIKEKYLVKKEFASTAQILNSSLTTPGEERPSSLQVLENGIREGVSMGLFGVGELIDDEPQCIYYKETATISFTGNEIIIKDEICKEQKKKEEKGIIGDKPIQQEAETEKEQEGTEKTIEKQKDSVRLKITVPKGKVSNLMGMMNLINMKFNTLIIQIEATGGSISEQDYEDKIMETLRQMGIEK